MLREEYSQGLLARGYESNRATAGSATSTAETVVDVLLQYLEQEGVEYIFGVPGGPLTALLEALRRRNTIKFVLAKHEEGAAFMANTYARVRGGLGVCCVTSGPGATNMLTGVAGAFTDGLPVLFISAQVATRAFGCGAIQESTVHGVDVVSILRPVTKLSAMLASAAGAPTLIRTALRTALSGRNGPVHLSIPADIAREKVTANLRSPRSYRATTAATVDGAAVTRAVDLLVGAERPCLLVGHGVAMAGATDALRELAERLSLPVVTSPKGKGTFCENHPLSLGVFGLGGHARAQEYLVSGGVDVLCVVGSSLNEFSSSAWEARLQPRRALIHIDIDPSEIGKNYSVDVAVVGDARAALESMNGYLERTLPAGALPPSRAELYPEIPKLDHAELMTSESSPLKPQRLVHEIRKAMPDDGMLFVDNGNSIIWGGHYFEIRRPGTYFIDLGLACMGSAVAAVVGGKIARPDCAAVALVGDAAFAMHGMEVHTAVEGRIPAVWVVLNNSGHGMVAQGDTILRGADLEFGNFRVPIDSAALGRSLGANGYRVETPRELAEALHSALRSDGPTVIDAVIDPTVVPPTLEQRVKTLARFFNGESNRH
jgi:acetolactate synthase-1/2/3 large subunit